MPPNTHPGFTSINAVTSLYTPDKNDPTTLIILCTWLGALKKHQAKYIALYQALAPTTPILLLDANVRTITRSYTAARQSMADPLTVVLRTLSTTTAPQEPKILLHMMSNGGSWSATQLLAAHHEKTGSALPLHGIVIDSAPGKGEYWKSYNAIRLTLPKQFPLSIVSTFMAHLIPAWMYSAAWMGLYPTFEDFVRDTLADEGMWRMRRNGAGVEVNAGRRRIAYLWGMGDVMIAGEDVVAHAEEVEKKGWEVRNVEFEGSGHCEHFRAHGERYEGAVKGMWSDE
ncbi:indole-diterpene biosynthesis protein-like protein PaxU [Massariosphaeria phaeospora]|uniref:Indole-diterpene biosynthesis protein-like protein PaxU n=1 Tax=Massariosphaeria phaeospora TaxID=100035 RepID=A0A7C8IEC9_9PLEO|nr:indole-diterpene biosynthesis protein-like protein PaxU [Massariosphaeria phaeospora]